MDQGKDLTPLMRWEERITYTARGLPRYEIEVHHDGLNKVRVIRDADQRLTREKARAQLLAWEDAWQKLQAFKRKKQTTEEKLQEAASRTEEVQEALKSVEETLVSALDICHGIDWPALRESFDEPKPEEPFLAGPPPKPDLEDSPSKPEVVPVSLPEPRETDDKYKAMLGIWKTKRSRSAAQEEFRRDHENWREDMAALQAQVKAELEAWKRECDRVKKENEECLKAWEEEKTRVERENQRRINEHEDDLAAWRTRNAEYQEHIDELKRDYELGDSEAVIECCGRVLEASSYPEWCPQEFEIDYNPETKILIVDYLLPAPGELPKIKEVNYIQKRDEFVEKELPQVAQKALYDSLIYQICLRTIHELYDGDTAETLDAVVFNGWVESIDPGTGTKIKPCILSVQAGREELAAINLWKIDPKACFKTLKGVGSSKLHALAPVPPVLQMDRKDRRFVASYDVASSIDDTTNLAAMDWKDFEHLIREVFEAEFAERGGEVKVTQASRDRGVDAVVFDPDPIAGGKIIIQAKRYTNVVGASAVRELHGTVEAEGANKGILVTTSDYGPDAYEWAKGKPLTLLNGGNLLHLLAKHGHKAKIDLQEAKRILTERELETK